MTNVFISHDSHKSEFVAELKNKLKEIQLTPVDGHEYINVPHDETVKLIADTSILIFLATNSNLSSQLQIQWEKALEQKKPIITVILGSDEAVLPEPLLRRRMQFTTMDQLIQRILWYLSPNGEIQVLRDRLLDLETELTSGISRYPDAIRDEVNEIRRRIEFKVQAEKHLSEIDNTDSMEKVIESDKRKFIREREIAWQEKPSRIAGDPPNSLGNFFQDRTKEAAQITNLLISDNEIRAVSVYGRSGVGKTALACDVLSALERDTDHFDGIIYLSANEEFGISLDSVYIGTGQIVGAPQNKKLETIWSSPNSTLAEKISALIELYVDYRIVILLDNLESLLDKDGFIIDTDLRSFVDTFLRRRHRSKLLITTTEPIRVANNLRIFLEPFPLDEGLPTKDAIALLRSFDRDNRLRLLSANEQVLQDLVEKTYGFPRALEAVAGLLDQDPHISPEDLLKDEELFVGEVVEKLVEAAFRRLDNDSLRVLQVLSAFKEPVTENAIQVVLQSFSLLIDVRNTIRRLARGRYITIKENTKEITLHQLDRAYAYQMLSLGKPPEISANEVEKRIGDYYSRLGAAIAESEWRSIGDIEPLIRELSHRIRALQYDESAKILNRIDYNFLSLWGHAKLLKEMREQIAGKVNDTALRGKNYAYLGLNCHALGDYRNAFQYHQQALCISYYLGDDNWKAANLNDLAMVYRQIGRLEKAMPIYEVAIAIAISVKDWFRAGNATGNLAFAHLDNANYNEAITGFGRAIRFHERVDDLHGVGIWLGGLGTANRLLGNYDEAIKNYEAANSIAKQIGDRVNSANWLGNIGTAYLAAGTLDSAINYYLQASQEARDIGDQRNEANWRSNLGIVYYQKGSPEKSVQTLEQVLKLTDDPRIRVKALGNLALALSSMNLPDKANLAISEALALVTSSGLTRLEGHVRYQHAIVLSRRDDTNRAISEIESAIAILSKYNQDNVLFDAHLVKAQQCVRANRSRDAEISLRTAKNMKIATSSVKWLALSMMYLLQKFSLSRVRTHLKEETILRILERKSQRAELAIYQGLIYAILVVLADDPHEKVRLRERSILQYRSVVEAANLLYFEDAKRELSSLMKYDNDNMIATILQQVWSE